MMKHPRNGTPWQPRTHNKGRIRLLRTLRRGHALTRMAVLSLTILGLYFSLLVGGVPTIGAEQAPTETPTPDMGTVTGVPTSAPLDEGDGTTTATPTVASTPFITPTATLAWTATPSVTPTEVITPTVVSSTPVLPTVTPTEPFTLTVPPSTPDTPTPVPTEPITLTATPWPVESPSATPVSSPSVPVTSTATPTETAEPTASVTPTVLPAPSATPTITPTPAVTVTVTVTPTETTVPEVSPTVTVTPIVTPTPVAFEGRYVPDEVLVRFLPLPLPGFSATTAAALAETHKIEVAGALSRLGVWVMKVPPGQVERVVSDLRQDPRVLFAEPNYIARAYLTPDDPSWPLQSYLSNIQAPQAWDVTTGSPEVVIAVVDTGVDLTHPDLVNKIWHNLGEMGLDAEGNDRRTNGVDDDGNGYVDDWVGWNTVAGTGDVQDDHGHGTYVAGVAAADTNNGQGIAGVSWGARIMPVKVLDSTGFGTYAQVAAGIIYATDQGARIINLSLGGTEPSALLEAAIGYAAAHGVTVIAATGDSGTSGVSYPAAYPSVIAVGATDGNNQIASFSTFGDAVDLVAPGVDVYSTYPGGYAQFSGTSVAAAHVSGVAALLASLPAFDTPDKIRAALEATALDLGEPGWDPYYGFGLVQAYDALTQPPPVGPTPTPTPTATPGPSPTPTATPTRGPTPTPSGGGGVRALVTEELWATAQNCDYPITDPANSIDLAFNDLVASCTGDFGRDRASWTYTAFQDTTLATIVMVTLDVRFYMTGWVDDRIDLEIFNGDRWYRLARFEGGEETPPGTLTTLSYDVSSWFTTPAEVNAAQLRFRGRRRNGGTDTITIYLDEARLNASDVIPTPTPAPPLPTPTSPPPAPTDVPIAGDPHVDYSPTTDSCAACHRSHTAYGMVLRQAWPEEDLCFGCHTDGGTGTNVQPAFTSYTNTSTRIFKHDIAATNGVHRIGQTTGADFGGTSRHVECEDCHEPHEATRGPSDAPMLQREMNYASGVDPVWTGPGAPTSYVWLQQAEREYQVCFKCHSSFTTLPTYVPDGWDGSQYVADGLRKLTSTDPNQVLDSRDMAQEFNPYNASFHPVVAQGRNQSIPAGSFVTGWSQTSMVYCTDCHSSADPTQGDGPHGSPLLHLLTGNGGQTNYVTAPGGWVTITSDWVCFKCHRYETYVSGTDPSTNTNFRRGNRNLHELHSDRRNVPDASCYACHDSHGSEQLHLINFDASWGGGITFLNGRNSQTAWTGNSCYLVCHGRDHSNITYP